MTVGLDDILVLGRVFLSVKRWRERRRLRKNLKEIGMLNGKKTYIGIAVAGIGVVLGWLGIGGEAEATELVTHLVELGGLLVAMYGRYVAKV